jgi:hypothetical protein
MLCRVVWLKFTDVSEVFAASIIALMRDEANTFETSVNFYQTTRRNNLEDSHIHTRRRQNLKSQLFSLDNFKIAEGLGGPLNNFTACFLTVAMHCAIHAKDANKEVGTILNLFHKYLVASVFLVCVFLFILFSFFIL